MCCVVTPKFVLRKESRKEYLKQSRAEKGNHAIPVGVGNFDVTVCSLVAPVHLGEFNAGMQSRRHYQSPVLEMRECEPGSPVSA